MPNHWDNYWENGIVSSISFDSGISFSKTIANYWTNFFGQQIDNCKILDVATGNLIVPVFALISSKNTNKLFDVHATDLAKIDLLSTVDKNPHLAEYLTQVKCLSRVNTEKLPFDNKSFDCITSMHGFEYSSPEKNLSEFVRVLKNNGKIKLLCHCENSIFLQKNKTIMDCTNYILNHSNIFGLIQEMSYSMGTITNRDELLSLKDNKNCEENREKFNNTVSQLQQKYGDILFATGISDFISTFFESLEQSTHTYRQSLIESNQISMGELLNRLIDLDKAALSQNQINGIKTHAQSLDLEIISSQKLHDAHNNVLGVTFELQK